MHITIPIIWVSTAGGVYVILSWFYLVYTKKKYKKLLGEVELYKKKIEGLQVKIADNQEKHIKELKDRHDILFSANY